MRDNMDADLQFILGESGLSLKTKQPSLDITVPLESSVHLEMIVQQYVQHACRTLQFLQIHHKPGPRRLQFLQHGNC